MYMQDFVLEKLSFFDSPSFKFDPKWHKYTINGKPLTSVTKFIQQFHKEFDQDFWSKKKAEEQGVEQEEILAEWKKLNERANFIGTSTHNWIENYFNGVHQQIPNDLDVVDRINKFNKVFAQNLYKLQPIKFEQRVFHEEWGLAGTFDALFHWNDKLIILDWKSNKSFTTTNEFGEKLLAPFEDLDRCHLNEYSLQVSLYKLILKQIGLDIKACYLLHIGPNDDAKIHKALDLSDKLLDFLTINSSGS
jgi:ATP-dependent exoDNAse (exonuclease V) beta subunit